MRNTIVQCELDRSLLSRSEQSRSSSAISLAERLAGRSGRIHTFFFADYEGRTAVSSITRARHRRYPLRRNVLADSLRTVTHHNRLPSPIRLPALSIRRRQIPASGDDFVFDGGSGSLLLPTQDWPTTIPAHTPTTTRLPPRGTINDDKGDGRVDHTFNDHWTIFGRYSEHRQVDLRSSGIPGRAGGNSNGNVNIQNRNIAGGADVDDVGQQAARHPLWMVAQPGRQVPDRTGSALSCWSRMASRMVCRPIRSWFVR